MLRILRRFCLCLLALFPAAAWAQTFPALAPLPGTGTLAAPAGPFRRTDPAGAKPLYVVSGGAGAPLSKKATPQTGGYHNYLLVQVKGAEVTVTVNKLP